uniref:Uncharacterized protein n=1 Tax=Pyxicephalus adspersus TaxID=30357 RepID=A0AAV3B8D5_PYXAD|nr:TPA: hypothetical protein GDO54_007865 [Pyxicephalus adspersus]
MLASIVVQTPTAQRAVDYSHADRDLHCQTQIGPCMDLVAVIYKHEQADDLLIFTMVNLCCSFAHCRYRYTRINTRSLSKFIALCKLHYRISTGRK